MPRAVLFFSLLALSSSVSCAARHGAESHDLERMREVLEEEPVSVPVVAADGQTIGGLIGAAPVEMDALGVEAEQEGVENAGMLGAQKTIVMDGIGGLVGAAGQPVSIGHRRGGVGAPPSPGAGAGDPTILGALDKVVIDQVVRDRVGAVEGCYQQGLTREPALAGRLVVKFVIDKDGSVLSATTKSSELGDAEVEACINGVIMGFGFPEPKGGGIVIVSYPFLFEPA